MCKNLDLSVLSLYIYVNTWYPCTLMEFVFLDPLQHDPSTIFSSCYLNSNWIKAMNRSCGFNMIGTSRKKTVIDVLKEV